MKRIWLIPIVLYVGLALAYVAVAQTPPTLNAEDVLDIQITVPNRANISLDQDSRDWFVEMLNKSEPIAHGEKVNTWSFRYQRVVDIQFDFGRLSLNYLYPDHFHMNMDLHSRISKRSYVLYAPEIYALFSHLESQALTGQGDIPEAIRSVEDGTRLQRWVKPEIPGIEVERRIYKLFGEVGDSE